MLKTAVRCAATDIPTSMSFEAESAPLIGGKNSGDGGGGGGGSTFLNPSATTTHTSTPVPTVDEITNEFQRVCSAALETTRTAPPVNDAEVGGSDKPGGVGRRRGAWVGALGALVGGAVVAVIVVATVLEANLIDQG